MLVHLASHPLLKVGLRKQCKQLGPEYVMSFDLIRSRLVGIIIGQRSEKVRSRDYLDLLGWIAQEPRLVFPDDFETRIRAGIPHLWIRLGLLTQLLVDPIVKFVQPASGITNPGMKRQLFLHKLGRRSPTILTRQHILDGIKEQLLVPQNYGVITFGLMMSH